MSNYELVKIRINVDLFWNNINVNGKELCAVVYNGVDAIAFFDNYCWFVDTSLFTVVRKNNEEASLFSSGTNLLSAIGDKPSKITIEF